MPICRKEYWHIKNITPKKILNLSIEEIKSIGTSTSKAICIKNISTAVLNNELNFNDFNSMSDDKIISQLTQIKGIGTWTAKMYLLFVLNRPDILPYEDVAFLQAYKWLYGQRCKTTKNAIERKLKKWKPYSSIAAKYLYTALNIGLTKKPLE